MENKEVKPLNKIPNPSVKRNFILLLSGLAVLLAIGAVYMLSQSKSENAVTTLDDSLMGQAPEVSPTPSPFQEMTIEYLRERGYPSSLGERKIVSENEDYTGYLTSYDSEGFKVNGLLTVPKGESPEGGWSAIVFIHGYIAPSTYQTLVNYSAYVDDLARQGFVVFKIDLRGHDSSEGEPSGAYYSSDYIIDVRSAISALENSNDVNSEKIGLWGHSMAGNVVLRTLVSKPEIPAAVIWAGAVYSYADWQKYGIEDNSYRPPGMSSERQRRRQQLFDTYGEFSPQSEFWRRVAPTNYLSDLKGAIQLNHAVDDAVVDIGYSRDLAELLEKENIEHELNEYQSGGHNIQGAAYTQAMQNTAEFFRSNL